MIYQRIEPSELLSPFVECYWIVDSEGDREVIRQKIIPDGFPEIIVHYGDTYRINISGMWVTQSKQLLAGQLTHYFSLENTGVSGMIGIKFKPTALSELFGLDMSVLTDKVVPLASMVPSVKIGEVGLDSLAYFISDFEEQLAQKIPVHRGVCANAVDLIIEKNGMLGVQELQEEIGLSERQLERLFKKQVGLSPKFYSRIIRLSYIFRQAEKNDYTWAKLAYQGGFTDQSHFIKNFKEFTGEDPSKYQFDHEDMANFFLKS
ncbi:MAG: helix-turn-helix transcriptional regulator [Marinoscillum sp.]